MGKFIPVDPDRWAELVKAAGERDALIVEVSHLTEENLLVREESDRHYGLFIKANAEVEEWKKDNRFKAVRIEAQILDRLVELKEENARLNSLIANSEHENARLKAEVERLTERLGGVRLIVTEEMYDELNTKYLEQQHELQNIALTARQILDEKIDLKEQVERLTKAVMHSPAAQLKLKELEGKTTFEEINSDNQ
jgi:hypothetical protein